MSKVTPIPGLLLVLLTSALVTACGGASSEPVDDAGAGGGVGGGEGGGSGGGSGGGQGGGSGGGQGGGSGGGGPLTDAGPVDVSDGGTWEADAAVDAGPDLCGECKASCGEARAVCQSTCDSLPPGSGDCDDYCTTLEACTTACGQFETACDFCASGDCNGKCSGIAGQCSNGCEESCEGTCALGVMVCAEGLCDALGDSCESACPCDG